MVCPRTTLDWRIGLGETAAPPRTDQCLSKVADRARVRRPEAAMPAFRRLLLEVEVAEPGCETTRTLCSLL